MKTETLYIHTIGCQMNVYDADRMVALLEPSGYRTVDSPEAADLVVVNTCAIRAKAEQKVFSYLGRLAKMKSKRPDLIIAVGGCVAQQEGRRILQRIPGVDLVFGTRAIERLPEHVDRIRKKRRPIVDVEMTAILDERKTPEHRDRRISRFVTIMRGCDNFCTYCVVPYVRGREVSRPPEAVLGEIRNLVAGGVREVTLLGQNVNSYGEKPAGCSFAQLLERIDGIEGLLRIRFTTSHPKDLSDDLVRAFGTLDKLCRHIHLPVQSGSDAVLRRMNRRYTREIYLDRIEKLRRHCPDIAISSDFIVGFPGETEADFQDSLQLIRDVAFDSLFAFMYSDRPQAPAARFSDRIPERVKNERLQILLDLQESISAAKNRSLIGTIQSVLIEEVNGRPVPSATGEHDPGNRVHCSGRTSGNRIVNFAVKPDAIGPDGVYAGRMIDVAIERALSHSLWGRPFSPGVASHAVKGENYAA